MTKHAGTVTDRSWYDASDEETAKDGIAICRPRDRKIRIYSDEIPMASAWFMGRMKDYGLAFMKKHKMSDVEIGLKVWI